MDGIFGPITYGSVRGFQQALGIVVYGIVVYGIVGSGDLASAGQRDALVLTAWPKPAHALP